MGMQQETKRAEMEANCQWPVPGAPEYAILAASLD